MVDTLGRTWQPTSPKSAAIMTDTRSFINEDFFPTRRACDA